MPLLSILKSPHFNILLLFPALVLAPSFLLGWVMARTLRWSMLWLVLYAIATAMAFAAILLLYAAASEYISDSVLRAKLLPVDYAFEVGLFAAGMGARLISDRRMAGLPYLMRMNSALLAACLVAGLSAGYFSVNYSGMHVLQIGEKLADGADAAERAERLATVRRNLEEYLGRH